MEAVEAETMDSKERARVERTASEHSLLVSAMGGDA